MSVTVVSHVTYDMVTSVSCDVQHVNIDKCLVTWLSCDLLLCWPLLVQVLLCYIGGPLPCFSYDLWHCCHSNCPLSSLCLRSAHLLLNLFALMIHSSIPDIAVEQEKSVQKVGVSVWGWGVGVRVKWGVGVRVKWGVGVRVKWGWEWGWGVGVRMGWGVGVRMRWGVGVRMRWGVGVRVNCLKWGLGSMCVGECWSIGVVEGYLNHDQHVHPLQTAWLLCLLLCGLMISLPWSYIHWLNAITTVVGFLPCLIALPHQATQPVWLCIVLYAVSAHPDPTHLPLWCDGCGDELMMVQYVLLLAVSFKCPIFCFRYVTSSIWSWAKRKPYECCRTSLMTVSMLYLLCFWREPTRWLR